jgi:hypothetical protein
MKTPTRPNVLSGDADAEIGNQLTYGNNYLKGDST